MTFISLVCTVTLVQITPILFVFPKKQLERGAVIISEHPSA